MRSHIKQAILIRLNTDLASTWKRVVVCFAVGAVREGVGEVAAGVRQGDGATAFIEVLRLIGAIGILLAD